MVINITAHSIMSQKHGYFKDEFDFATNSMSATADSKGVYTQLGAMFDNARAKNA